MKNVGKGRSGDEMDTSASISGLRPKGNEPKVTTNEQEMTPSISEESANAAENSSTAEKTTRFVFKEYTAWVKWQWKPDVEKCAICGNHLPEKCNLCIASIDSVGDCLISTGRCKHAYHKHCLGVWLQSASTCPYCQADWVEEHCGTYV